MGELNHGIHGTHGMSGRGIDGSLKSVVLNQIPLLFTLCSSLFTLYSLPITHYSSLITNQKVKPFILRGTLREWIKRSIIIAF